MGGLQRHLGRAALVMGLHETRRTQAPVVAGLQPGKVELRARGAQVVADVFGIGQELGRHDGTDRMAALIGGAGVAVPIAKEPGHRVHRAGLQRPAQYVHTLVAFHGVSLQALRDLAEHFYVLGAYALVAEFAVCARGRDQHAA